MTVESVFLDLEKILTDAKTGLLHCKFNCPSTAGMRKTGPKYSAKGGDR